MAEIKSVKFELSSEIIDGCVCKDVITAIMESLVDTTNKQILNNMDAPLGLRVATALGITTFDVFVSLIKKYPQMGKNAKKQIIDIMPKSIDEFLDALPKYLKSLKQAKYNAKEMAKLVESIKKMNYEQTLNITIKNVNNWTIVCKAVIHFITKLFEVNDEDLNKVLKEVEQEDKENKKDKDKPIDKTDFTYTNYENIYTFTQYVRAQEKLIEKKEKE